MERLSSPWKQRFRRRMLAWFDRNARDLPWRRTRDPYCIWISEIMLQQTQVATVCDYYKRFIQRFPNVQALADAQETDVLRMWEGLGYYRRARQMHAAAQQIQEQHQGVFPTDLESVLALPGVGRYTAGAITSIAYDLPAPILEANTIRLFARLIGLRSDPTTSDSQKQLWAFAEAILPRKNAGRFNQSLMELGSLLCTPKSPRCDACPVADQCAAFAGELQSKIPAPKKKVQYEEVTEAAVIVRHGECVLVRQCAKGERWAGLWDFPRTALATSVNCLQQLETAVQQQTGAQIQVGERLTTMKHGVTRFRITLHCYEAKCITPPQSSNSLHWVKPTELSDYPLSVTGRKLAQQFVHPS